MVEADVVLLLLLAKPLPAAVSNFKFSYKKPGVEDSPVKTSSPNIHARTFYFVLQLNGQFGEWQTMNVGTVYPDK